MLLKVSCIEYFDTDCQHFLFCELLSVMCCHAVHAGMLCKFDRKTVVVGAGYIAVELAGILNSLGSDVSLLIRFDQVNRFACKLVHI